MITIAEQVAAALDLAVKGRADKAAEMLRDLATTHPSSVDVALGFAHLALIEGDAPRALDRIAKPASAFPGHPGVIRVLVMIYRALERPADALTVLQRAIDSDPQDLGALIAAMELSLQVGALEDALRHADAALQLAPDQAPVHVTIGLVLLNCGLEDGAAKAFAEACRLDPKLPAARHNLAQLLLKTAGLAAALPHAEAAHAVDPNDIDMALGYARLLVSQGERTDAEAVLRKVLILAPGHIEAIELQARLAIDHGEADRGVVLMAQAIRRDAKDPAPLHAFVRVLRDASRSADALVAIQKLAAMQPKDANIDRERREILCCLGRFDEAWSPGDSEAARAARQTVAALAIHHDIAASELMVLMRYLPRLAALPRPISIIGDHDLMPLIARLPGVTLVSPEAAGDARSALALPALLGLTSADVPGLTPYLVADPDLHETWTASLAPFPHPWIGVAYSTAGGLTMDLARAAIGAIDTPVSLALGNARSQLAAWPEAIDAGLHIRSPDDLVAAVAALDYVIGVDGLAMHCAGALGRPGLVVLPPATPWYWLRAADQRSGRSRFYPSLDVVNLSGRFQTEAAIPGLRARLEAALAPAGAAARDAG